MIFYTTQYGEKLEYSNEKKQCVPFSHGSLKDWVEDLWVKSCIHLDLSEVKEEKEES